MKKVVSIILLLCVVCLNCGVKASDASAVQETTVNITFETVTEDNIVTVKISTGNFEQVEENCVMTATMTLVYDENDIIDFSGEVADDWKITIATETNRVLLETDSASPNTQIAELTFELNADVTETTSGTIAIQDFNISDGDLLDETYTLYTATYTITPAETDENNGQETDENDNQNTSKTDDETQSQVDNTTSTSQVQETNKGAGSTVNNTIDNTVIAETKLPQTGASSILFIGLILVAAVNAVIKFVRYKGIEIK